MSYRFGLGCFALVLTTMGCEKASPPQLDHDAAPRDAIAADAVPRDGVVLDAVSDVGSTPDSRFADDSTLADAKADTAVASDSDGGGLVDLGSTPDSRLVDDATLADAEADTAVASDSGRRGRVLMFESFDTHDLPTPMEFAAQGGAKLELVDSTAGAHAGRSLKVTYPAQPSGSEGAVFAWGGVDLTPYQTDNVYIRFRAKMPKAKHGVKFVKIFGLQNEGAYANTTLGLDYTGVDLGGLYAVSFGDGETPQNDTASVILLDGTSRELVGRSYNLPGYSVLTPQKQRWSSTDWGTSWHLFEMHAKFNSGTSRANETNDGEYSLKIDGKVYVDARGIFNRHFSNQKLWSIQLLGWTQPPRNQAAPEFELWFDNIEVSIDGWGDSPV